MRSLTLAKSTTAFPWSTAIHLLSTLMTSWAGLRTCSPPLRELASCAFNHLGRQRATQPPMQRDWRPSNPRRCRDGISSPRCDQAVVAMQFAAVLEFLPAPRALPRRPRPQQALQLFDEEPGPPITLPSVPLELAVGEEPVDRRLGDPVPPGRLAQRQELGFRTGPHGRYCRYPSPRLPASLY
jgi:hypothetical protein